jgi:ABC-2 type transport system ATP-binding protein
MNEFCTSVAIMERGSLVVGGRIDEVNRRVMGDALVSVEVLGAPEAFLSIIAGELRAGPVVQKNGAFEFRFQGDAEAASDLLAGLVQQGVRVASFQRRRDNLEDLFQKVGSKELS